jgi:hypothetical protein
MERMVITGCAGIGALLKLQLMAVMKDHDIDLVNIDDADISDNDYIAKFESEIIDLTSSPMESHCTQKQSRGKGAKRQRKLDRGW